MTIRFRLTIGLIAIILIANSVLYILTVRHISSVLLQEVQTRVSLDLNSAWTVYNNRIESIERFLTAVSLNESIASALKKDDRFQLKSLMQAIFEEGNIDMLSLIGMDGKVIYRSTNPEMNGDDVKSNPLIAIALRERTPLSGTTILSRELLEKESKELAERAYMEILPTPAARPTKERFQRNGMVIASAVFITDRVGEKVGLLLGANLLNRRYRIVDIVKDEIFQNQTYEGKDIGTATIFQGDLRISTNVMNKDGSRAIGTRLSEKVYDKVLVKGEYYADRAFVVNDWYITAYAPIRDVENRIVGALYVGLLEAPFVRPHKVIVDVFLMLLAVTTIASLFLIFLITKLILRPIGTIIRMSNNVIRGDLTARVRIRPKGEMGDLCRAIDQMADAVEDREEQLKIATSRQIGQSEKLASIGRLAAGIAHEINNPLTGVLTFAYLLKQNKGMDEQSKEDVDVIIRETTRVREIVQGLLNFARESPSQKQMLDINQALRDTITLLRSQKEFGKITIVENLSNDLPPIPGDKNQLQQVFLNISLNACEAMEKGGIFSITTSAKNNNIVIAFSDSGHGIKKEHLDKIFDPFFTTKPVGKGTGLGLSVSYGIIQQHAGTIQVESHEGKGSIFTIALPLESVKKRNNAERGVH